MAHHYPKTDERLRFVELFFFWLTCNEVGPDSKMKEDGPDSMYDGIEGGP